MAGVLLKQMHRRRSRQGGVTSIEYGLIATLIAVAILGALSATGDNGKSMWTGWMDVVLNIISR